MADFTREQLAGYLDDALSDTETARVEKALRESEPLRQQLRLLMQERDRGEHSLGAVWRRRRLSCPTREQLGSYLLDALEKEHHDYVRFHLETVGCSFCLANLSDLQTLQTEPPAKTRERRKRIFETSSRYLSREDLDGKRRTHR
jgi:hypothetical protein